MTVSVDLSEKFLLNCRWMNYSLINSAYNYFQISSLQSDQSWLSAWRNFASLAIKNVPSEDFYHTAWMCSWSESSLGAKVCILMLKCPGDRHCGHGSHLENLFWTERAVDSKFIGSIEVTCRLTVAKIILIGNPRWLPSCLCLLYFPATELFTCIKSWFFRNHIAICHQISHWSYCWNVIENLFKWSRSIYCRAIYIRLHN